MRNDNERKILRITTVISDFIELSSSSKTADYIYFYSLEIQMLRFHAFNI